MIVSEYRKTLYTVSIVKQESAIGV